MDTEQKKFAFLKNTRFDTVTQILADLYISYQDNNEQEAIIKKDISDLTLFFKDYHSRINTDVLTIINWLCFDANKPTSIPLYFIERMNEIGIMLPEEKFFRYS